MKNNREVRSKMAAMLERVALKAYNTDAKRWALDTDMLNMFCGDLADHKRVAKLIRKNQLVEAWEELNEMDTAARDTAPLTVWNWLFTLTDGDD